MRPCSRPRVTLEKRPHDVRLALARYALAHGRVFVVLRSVPSAFEMAITQRMPRVA